MQEIYWGNTYERQRGEKEGVDRESSDAGLTLVKRKGEGRRKWTGIELDWGASMIKSQPAPWGALTQRLPTEKSCAGQRQQAFVPPLCL